MAQKEQTLKSHVKWDPLFHFFLGPVAIFMLVDTIVQLVRNPGWTTAVHVVAGLWALVATFKIRFYALKVQDRVIRLEERLRLKELAPAFAGKAAQLNENQLIGLRFASDGEVVGLAEKALAGGWSRKQIKKAIQNWRPDHWRV